VLVEVVVGFSVVVLLLDCGLSLASPGNVRSINYERYSVIRKTNGKNYIGSHI